MQQIYRRTLLQKCNFNKVAKHLWKAASGGRRKLLFDSCFFKHLIFRLVIVLWSTLFLHHWFLNLAYFTSQRRIQRGVRRARSPPAIVCNHLFLRYFVLIEVKLIIHNAAVLKQKDVSCILKKFFFFDKKYENLFYQKILVLFFFFNIFQIIL